MKYFQRVKRSSVAIVAAVILPLAGLAPAAAIPVLFSSFSANPSLVRSPTTISFPSQSRASNPGLTQSSTSRSNVFGGGRTFNANVNRGSGNTQLTFSGGNQVFSGGFVTRSSGRTLFGGNRNRGSGGTSAGQGTVTTLFNRNTRRGFGGRLQSQLVSQQASQTSISGNLQATAQNPLTVTLQSSTGQRTTQAENVPEPSVAILLLLGSGSLIALRTRRRRPATAQS